MPDERSSFAYDIYQKAAQQFDYLVTGATGAVCTYIVQTFKPKRIDVSPYTLELIALFVLVLSVVLGFKMIEGKVTVMKINAQWLRNQERLGALTDAYANLAHTPGLNRLTGELLTAQGVTDEIPKLQEIIKLQMSSMDHRADVCSRLYKWRNRALACGFLLLVASRLAGPYT